MKSFLIPFVPPVIVTLYKEILARINNNSPEYEFIPGGWAAAAMDPKIKGWNVDTVLEAYRKNWPDFVKSLEANRPFGLSPESPEGEDFDLVYHNTLMVFAYSLALAARMKTRISMLDWGGGIGHYYLLAQKLVPGLAIEYSCKDVGLLAAAGQQLFPEAHFFSNEGWKEGRYDFILASCSLHYSEDWPSVLEALASCCRGYLLVTRLPVTFAGPPFTFVQRPYRYGYGTEYLGWAVSREVLLQRAEVCGLQLVREFVTGERPAIVGAPSACEYRAYLFATGGRS